MVEETEETGGRRVERLPYWTRFAVGRERVGKGMEEEGGHERDQNRGGMFSEQDQIPATDRHPFEDLLSQATLVIYTNNP